MKRDAVLWIALLGGPVIWLTSFLINFALAPLACTNAWKPALYAVSATAMLLTLASGSIGFRQWQRLGRQMPGEGGDPDSRARAMATAVMASSGFSALAILAQAMVEILIGACQ